MLFTREARSFLASGRATTPDSRPPHLLHFGISHYNEKVRWALDRKRVPHTREAFVPARWRGRAAEPNVRAN